MASIYRIFKLTLIIVVVGFGYVKYMGFESKVAGFVDYLLNPEKYPPLETVEGPEPLDSGVATHKSVSSSDQANLDLLDAFSEEGSYQSRYNEICVKKDAPIKNKASTKLYSWVDKNGVVNFGDRPPAAASYEQQQMASTGKDYFDVEIQYPGGDVPALLGETVAVGGRAIYAIYEQYFPANQLSKSHISMKVFGDSVLFKNYQHEVAPEMKAAVSGFYSGELNSVAVMHSGNDQQTRRTALHEFTHAIQFKNFGPTSGWYSEGMAEYFENIKVVGFTKTIGFNQYWKNLLDKPGNRLALKTLLSADYSNWKGDDRSIYYGNSWALVYFMMLPENTKLMKTYQLFLVNNKCEPIDHIAFYNRNYAGGVFQLEQDWLRWLDGPHVLATRY